MRIASLGASGEPHRVTDEKPIADVTELKAKVRRSKVRLAEGDLVAIPIDDSPLVRMLIYLGRHGHFGEAFGVVRGRHPMAPFDGQLTDRDVAGHFFVSLEPIERGRWTVVGHRTDLRPLFSAVPEYFHRKSDHPEDDGIGPYGSAETPYRADGTGSVLRELSEEEAAAIGLEHPSFRMSPTEAQLAAWLAERFDVG